MDAIKRNGETVAFARGKIVAALNSLMAEEPTISPDLVDVEEIARRVEMGVYNGVKTRDVSKLLSQTLAADGVVHPAYLLLAGRVEIAALRKTTPATFGAYLARARTARDKNTGKPRPLLSEEFHKLATAHLDAIEPMIDQGKDFERSYFGVNTLAKSYLLRDADGIVERPQYMLMRVALALYKDDMLSVEKCYNDMANGLYTHATPTLFNAGTPTGQLSSCYLLPMQSDSIRGIFNTITDCALISQGSGGIGFSAHNVRAQGSPIGSTGGKSNGIVPMLRVFNNTARYVDQGGGKRKGSFACYLEPWHADVLDFLEMKKNHGSEELRARDLFFALWIPDLFMRRVEANEKWTLMCPSACPDLPNLHGDEFDRAYCKYEADGLGVSEMPAQDLWANILQAMMESGSPYILFKDACNKKSNHRHLGTIQCSNLCTEIVQYTRPTTDTMLGETAVCNLASLALPKFVNEKGEFDHIKLHAAAGQVTRNLDRLIDMNSYPIPEAENSNKLHRPIGIGVQGLADTFMKMGLPYVSTEAQKLNVDIFETIYHGALTASCELAAEHGSYPSFKGSPFSNGLFQFDLWGVTPESGHWDWEHLRKKVSIHGARNSLLTAPMPTASTAQILGNTESFEPQTSNMYTRRVLSGEYPVVNPYLVEVLQRHSAWTSENRSIIIESNGSIKDIPGIPPRVKEVFKTVWEIPMKPQIAMAAARGAYIDQSQSFNLHIAKPEVSILTPCLFYAWKSGLKTGCYYLRQRVQSQAVRFGNAEQVTDQPSKSDMCEACGS